MIYRAEPAFIFRVASGYPHSLPKNIDMVALPGPDRDKSEEITFDKISVCRRTIIKCCCFGMVCNLFMNVNLVSACYLQK